MRERPRAGSLRGTLLARHGETDDNIEPIRIQGFRDTPLNDAGRRQAIGLAQRVEGEGIASLWSSDLIRASETAQIVGEHLGLKPRLDARLREGNRGNWEGRLWIEIERENPEGYAAWRGAGPDFRFPGGESLQEQSARVLAALDGDSPAWASCRRSSSPTAARFALCSAASIAAAFTPSMTSRCRTSGS